MNNPTPEQIKAARQAAGLTQAQAGALLHTTVRTWQQWEAGDRAMHQAFWELFQMKIAPPPALIAPDPRAIFERTFNLSIRQAQRTKDGTGYQNADTQAKWEGWQAAQNLKTGETR